MIELIVFTVVWAVAFVFGWTAREKYAERRLNQLLDETQNHIAKSISENLIRIEIERHNNRFYVYDMKDKSFLAQGTDQSEVEQILMERFPGKRFAATQDNLNEMGFGHIEK